MRVNSSGEMETVSTATELPLDALPRVRPTTPHMTPVIPSATMIAPIALRDRVMLISCLRHLSMHEFITDLINVTMCLCC